MVPIGIAMPTTAEQIDNRFKVTVMDHIRNRLQEAEWERHGEQLTKLARRMWSRDVWEEHIINLILGTYKIATNGKLPGGAVGSSKGS